MMKISIFRHYDRNRKTILKIDFSDWCLDEVLFQYDDEKIFHSKIFFNKKMIFVECNYEIYDKKFLIIIRCLKHWRFEFENIDEFVEIYIDHKNLKIFITSKKFTFHQIRWVEVLIDYNIKIQYQFEIKNVKTNVLILSQWLMLEDFCLLFVFWSTNFFCIYLAWLFYISCFLHRINIILFAFQ